MSGFGVLLSRSGTIDPPHLARLEADLRYRGADGVSSIVLGGCALVHAKTSTTEEHAREQQPLHHVHHDWWMVADARIDNRDELRGMLRGHVQHPLDTDADYIMAAFELWGLNCTQHMVGDFAFAVWQNDRSQLTVVRDQMGGRPVFWAADRSTFVAASTLRAVHSQLDPAPTLDEGHLVQVATGQLTSTTDTFWSGVSRLAPGSRLEVGPDLTATTQKYWALSPSIQEMSVGEAAEGVRALFEQAVVAQTRAIGPVGVHLSGGYDSSTVLSVARRMAPDTEMIAFGLRFANPEADERRYAEAAARHSGTPTVFVDTETIPFVDLSVDCALSGSAFRGYDSHWYDALSTELCARGGRVMLTGLGGDHLLECSGLPEVDLLRRLRFREAYRHTAAISTQNRPRQLLRASRTAARVSLEEWGCGWVVDQVRALKRENHAFASAASSLLTPKGAALLAPPMPPNKRTGPWAYATSARSELMHDPYLPYLFEAWNHLAEAGGIEQRNPFFDRRLVEFALSVSPALVQASGEYRGLHRRAFAHDLPPTLASRVDKADFTRVVSCVATGSVQSEPFDAAAASIGNYVNPVVLARRLEDAARYCNGEVDGVRGLFTTIGCLTAAAWAKVWHSPSPGG